MLPAIIICAICISDRFLGALAKPSGELSIRNSEHFYVFVGGAHGSGAGTVERILSSQYWSSGFRVDLTEAASNANCITPTLPGRCKAPDNEGVFLTKTFANHYIKQGEGLSSLRRLSIRLYSVHRRYPWV